MLRRRLLQSTVCSGPAAAIQGSFPFFAAFHAENKRCLHLKTLVAALEQSLMQQKEEPSGFVRCNERLIELFRENIQTSEDSARLLEMFYSSAGGSNTLASAPGMEEGQQRTAGNNSPSAPPDDLCFVEVVQAFEHYFVTMSDTSDTTGNGKELFLVEEAEGPAVTDVNLLLTEGGNGEQLQCTPMESLISKVVWEKGGATQNQIDQTRLPFRAVLMLLKTLPAAATGLAKRETKATDTAKAPTGKKKKAAIKKGENKGKAKKKTAAKPDESSANDTVQIAVPLLHRVQAEIQERTQRSAASMHSPSVEELPHLFSAWCQITLSLMQCSKQLHVFAPSNRIVAAGGGEEEEGQKHGSAAKSAAQSALLDTAALLQTMVTTKLDSLRTIVKGLEHSDQLLVAKLHLLSALLPPSRSTCTSPSSSSSPDKKAGEKRSHSGGGHDGWFHPHPADPSVALVPNPAALEQLLVAVPHLEGILLLAPSSGGGSGGPDAHAFSSSPASREIRNPSSGVNSFLRTTAVRTKLPAASGEENADGEDESTAAIVAGGGRSSGGSGNSLLDTLLKQRKTSALAKQLPPEVLHSSLLEPFQQLARKVYAARRFLPLACRGSDSSLTLGAGGGCRDPQWLQVKAVLFTPSSPGLLLEEDAEALDRVRRCIVALPPAHRFTVPLINEMLAMYSNPKNEKLGGVGGGAAAAAAVEPSQQRPLFELIVSAMAKWLSSTSSSTQKGGAQQQRLHHMRFSFRFFRDLQQQQPQQGQKKGEANGQGTSSAVTLRSLLSAKLPQALQHTLVGELQHCDAYDAYELWIRATHLARLCEAFAITSPQMESGDTGERDCGSSVAQALDVYYRQLQQWCQGVPAEDRLRTLCRKLSPQTKAQKRILWNISKPYVVATVKGHHHQEPAASNGGNSAATPPPHAFPSSFAQPPSLHSDALAVEMLFNAAKPLEKSGTELLECLQVLVMVAKRQHSNIAASTAAAAAGAGVSEVLGYKLSKFGGDLIQELLTLPLNEAQLNVTIRSISLLHSLRLLPGRVVWRMGHASSFAKPNLQQLAGAPAVGSELRRVCCSVWCSATASRPAARHEEGARGRGDVAHHQPLHLLALSPKELHQAVALSNVEKLHHNIQFSEDQLAKMKQHLASIIAIGSDKIHGTVKRGNNAAPWDDDLTAAGDVTDESSFQDMVSKLLLATTNKEQQLEQHNRQLIQMIFRRCLGGRRGEGLTSESTTDIDKLASLFESLSAFIQQQYLDPLVFGTIPAEAEGEQQSETSSLSSAASALLGSSDNKSSSTALFLQTAIELWFYAKLKATAVTLGSGGRASPAALTEHERETLFQTTKHFADGLIAVLRLGGRLQLDPQAAAVVGFSLDQLDRSLAILLRECPGLRQTMHLFTPRTTLKAKVVPLAALSHLRFWDIPRHVVLELIKALSLRGSGQQEVQVPASGSSGRGGGGTVIIWSRRPLSIKEVFHICTVFSRQQQGPSAAAEKQSGQASSAFLSLVSPILHATLTQLMPVLFTKQHGRQGAGGGHGGEHDHWNEKDFFAPSKLQDYTSECKPLMRLELEEVIYLAAMLLAHSFAGANTQLHLQAVTLLYMLRPDVLNFGNTSGRQVPGFGALSSPSAGADASRKAKEASQSKEIKAMTARHMALARIKEQNRMQEEGQGEGGTNTNTSTIAGQSLMLLDSASSLSSGKVARLTTRQLLQFLRLLSDRHVASFGERGERNGGGGGGKRGHTPSQASLETGTATPLQKGAVIGKNKQNALQKESANRVIAVLHFTVKANLMQHIPSMNCRDLLETLTRFQEATTRNRYIPRDLRDSLVIDKILGMYQARAEELAAAAEEGDEGRGKKNDVVDD